MSRLEIRCRTGFVVLTGMLLVAMLSTAGAADPFTMQFPVARDSQITGNDSHDGWPVGDDGWPEYDPALTDLTAEFASGGLNPLIRGKKGVQQTVIMDWDTDAINAWLDENTDAGDEISWTLNVYPDQGPPEDVTVATIESLNDWAEGDQPGNSNTGNFEWSPETAAVTFSFAQARYVSSDVNGTGVRTLDVENSLPWVDNDTDTLGRNQNEFAVLARPDSLARGYPIPDWVNSQVYTSLGLTIAATFGRAATLPLDDELVAEILVDPDNRGIVFGPNDDPSTPDIAEGDTNESSNWQIWTREGSGGFDDDGNPVPVPPEEFPGPLAPFLEVTVTPGEGGLLGDMNVNGLVDFDDIAPFNLGLTNAAEYETLYGQAPVVNGDTDFNGIFDFDDIVGFVALLGGGQAVGVVVPEPSSLALVGLGMAAFALAWRRRS